MFTRDVTLNTEKVKPERGVTVFDDGLQKNLLNINAMLLFPDTVILGKIWNAAMLSQLINLAKQATTI